MEEHSVVHSTGGTPFLLFATTSSISPLLPGPSDCPAGERTRKKQAGSYNPKGLYQERSTSQNEQLCTFTTMPILYW